MELIPGHIPAPQVQERRKASLLTSAIPGPDTGGVDWRKGVIAWPESAPSYRVVQDCTDEAAEYGDETEFGPVGARPFVIQTVTKCPRGSIAAMAARAERHIRAITSQALAYELWTGEATALDPWSLPEGQVSLANPRGNSYLSTPGNVVATPSGTGGTLAAGTYYYRVAAVNAQGQTLASTQVSSGALTGTTSSVALTWTAVTGATGYRVYRTTTSGTYTTPALLASPSGASYTDTGGAVGAGAPVATNTASFVGTADEGPWLNPFLNDATMLASPIADATQAMGAVEAAVAERMAGGPVYLHVPTDFVMGMGADLQPVGDLLQTPTGSIVVADAGYPGPGATGDDLVIYGTGPVTVWLGEPTVYDQSSWVVDHTTNQVAVWAERPALIWFDPQTLVGCTVSA